MSMKVLMRLAKSWRIRRFAHTHKSELEFNQFLRHLKGSKFIGLNQCLLLNVNDLMVKARYCDKEDGDRHLKGLVQQ